MVIQPPKNSNPYPDRALDCEIAVSGYIRELMRLADLTGTHRDMAAVSLFGFSGTGDISPILRVGQLFHEAFQTLIIEAEKSGWQRDELREAIGVLCKRQLRQKVLFPDEAETKPRHANLPN